MTTYSLYAIIVESMPMHISPVNKEDTEQDASCNPLPAAVFATFYCSMNPIPVVAFRACW